MLRTRTYFQCSNGHIGLVRTSENDAPFSSNWHSVKHEGLRGKEDGPYVCSECGLPMRAIETPGE